MRSEAAAQVLNCRQAVDDPKRTLRYRAIYSPAGNARNALMLVRAWSIGASSIALHAQLAPTG